MHTARLAPEVVTLHLWGVAAGQIPWALGRMALHRKLLKTNDATPDSTPAKRGSASTQPVPGLRFAKLLGTGHGRSFTPTDADPKHWALIASWETAEHADAFESGRLVSDWDAHSTESWRLRLRPLSSTGRWSGKTPFGDPSPKTRTESSAEDSAAPYAILTRARLVPSKMLTFWRAVPPVVTAMQQAEGLRFARGIGEAPLGLQATFSVWDDLSAATNFAYRSPAHRHVIERTAETGWYCEQLFARFAVIESSGVVDGRDPLGMRSGAGGQFG